MNEKSKAFPFEPQLRVDQIAKRFGISESVIYRAIHDGEIGHVIHGKRGYRIPVSAAQEYYEKRYRPVMDRCGEE